MSLIVGFNSLASTLKHSNLNIAFKWGRFFIDIEGTSGTMTSNAMNNTLGEPIASTVYPHGPSWEGKVGVGPWSLWSLKCTMLWKHKLSYVNDLPTTVAERYSIIAMIWCYNLHLLYRLAHIPLPTTHRIALVVNPLLTSPAPYEPPPPSPPHPHHLLSSHLGKHSKSHLSSEVTLRGASPQGTMSRSSWATPRPWGGSSTMLSTRHTRQEFCRWERFWKVWGQVSRCSWHGSVVRASFNKVILPPCHT